MWENGRIGRRIRGHLIQDRLELRLGKVLRTLVKIDRVDLHPYDLLVVERQRLMKLQRPV